MKSECLVEMSIVGIEEELSLPNYDLDQLIFNLEGELDLLSSQADGLDILTSVGCGLLCSLVDILWVGEFDLAESREMSSDRVDSFVLKTAKLLGYEGDELKGAVRFLEGKFPIPSDASAAKFGGGLQHHLRDFAHHPTIVGLMFSLLTQFTYKSYGTDVTGTFKVVDIPIQSRNFIGEDTAAKIIYGTFTWFFHLVSDMAGSSNSAGQSGGTGIPGPLLSLAKEIAALPVFRNINTGEYSPSAFLSRLFNGTLFAQCDEESRIIKETVVRFDLRGEIGFAFEAAKQALPVVANECIVRLFYLIRRLAVEIKSNEIKTIDEIKKLNWDRVKPFNNPTIDRMLTISTGVFTGVDIAEAAIRQVGSAGAQSFWLSINYVGVGRFAVAIGSDVSWGLKKRHVREIKKVYEDIRHSSFRKQDNALYERMGRDMREEKFGLTIEQTEILYNLEYYKVLNDIKSTKTPINTESVKALKQKWLEEWKSDITKAFSAFLGIDNAAISWYSEEDLIKRIEDGKPEKTWFRLVLLEAMLFEPYYSLGIEKNKKGINVPSRAYKELANLINGFDVKKGDDYLNSLFKEAYYEKNYISRLRKSYKKITLEMKEVLKSVLIGGAVTAGVALATIATAGALAPTIAVVLVGSQFAGISGAALTSACLAYLGGGAIAVGGAGMAGGTMVIVGGGAMLGAVGGLGMGGSVAYATTLGKQNTILQSAKLLVAVREIFLNDEHDLNYSNTVYEQYLEQIISIERDLIELRLQEDVASKQEKKELKEKIKNAEESVKAMKIARKNLLRFKSSFEVGECGDE